METTDINQISQISQQVQFGDLISSRSSQMSSFKVDKTNLLNSQFKKRPLLFGSFAIAVFFILNFVIYLYWQQNKYSMMSQSNGAKNAEATISKFYTETNQKIKQLQKNINVLHQKLRQTKNDPSSTNVKNNQVGKLPLNLPTVKSNGQKQPFNQSRIEDVLYSTDAIRNKRVDFQKQRVDFINSKNNYFSIFLAKSNLILSPEEGLAGIKDNQNDWNRLEAKFKLSAIKTQLPMCLIIPGFNNNANFRIQPNLNSIFLQNYTNYKAVIINDASTDGSDDIYRRYFEFYQIDKKNYVYIENTKRLTALQNIYKASMQHCSRNSIAVTLDADDQFVGRNVLQVFNWAYQTKKAGVVYSNFFWYQLPSSLKYGGTSEYSDKQKKQNLYRSTSMKFSQLRSYQTQLIHQIDPKDLQDEKGAFYTITYDIALFMPLMELSCGRVYRIDGEYHYLYNTGTGLNDSRDYKRQVAVNDKIRSQKKYECYKPFDQKMKK